jgi:hypothetical protein
MVFGPLNQSKSIKSKYGSWRNKQIAMPVENILANTERTLGTAGGGVGKGPLPGRKLNAGL